MRRSFQLFLFFFVLFFGATGYALATGTCTRQVSCQHLVACAHTMTCQHLVATTKVVPCQHYVTTEYGTTTMHAGDTTTVMVPAHAFDVQHPGGDFLHSFDVETYACGY